MPAFLRVLALFGLAMLLAAGAAQAQRSRISFAATDRTDCFSRCNGGCSMAYYFSDGRRNNCLWTTDARPNLSMGLPYDIWSGRHQRRLGRDSIVELFPQAVVDQPNYVTRDMLAAARARLQSMGQQHPAPTDLPANDMDIVTAAQDACSSRLAGTGTAWIVRYGTPNWSRYYEHRGVLCYEGGGALYVPDGQRHLQRYNCGTHFDNCRRSPGDDVWVGDGRAGPPGSSGDRTITRHWVMQSRDGSSLTNPPSIFIVRY